MTKLAPVVWPNAGVEAAYRRDLYAIVNDMSDDMESAVRDAWTEMPHALAQDEALITAAGIAFRDLSGRYLLLHRTDGQGWAFPGGGCEWGETPEQTARREVMEEIGWWDAGKPALMLDRRTVSGVQFTTFEVRSGYFVPKLNDEHDNWGWFERGYALSRDLRGEGPLHHGVRETLRNVPVAVDARPTTPRLQRVMDKWATKWIGRVDKMAQRLAERFASKAKTVTDAMVKASFEKAGMTVKWKPTAGMRSAYSATVAENVGLIKSIPQQYLTQVQGEVWRGVMKGSDLKQITDALYERYDITRNRAALIARDQNNKAKATFEDQRRKELGIDEAEWMHSSAGMEPRPKHVEWGQQKKRFKVGVGLVDVDGERVLPGQKIRCRCSSRAVIPGFE